MNLAENESILFEEGASHFHNFIAVGGKLVVTNQRVLFQSSPCFRYQHEVKIGLDSISSIDFFKTMFLNPNGLTIMLKDGSIENFIVDDRKVWRSRILQEVTNVA
jgi:hypothetical protein